MNVLPFPGVVADAPSLLDAATDVMVELDFVVMEAVAVEDWPRAAWAQRYADLLRRPIVAAIRRQHESDGAA